MSEFDQSKNLNIISVTELNTSAKKILEKDFSSIWVSGEVTNFRSYDSGHWYFKIKDSNSEIQCVMFKFRNTALNNTPSDGDQLLIKGSISMYIAKGSYQFQVDQIEYAGEGVLLKNYEALKNKLLKEGLFNEENKQKLPLLPKHIAVITSPNGAVIEDIRNVLTRRSPLISVSLIPSLVQGEDSVQSLRKALVNAKELNKQKNIDAVIIARGGGSLEDLWSFNSEELARDIFDFDLPVISAIGHETDFTICDFVSDLRVPTPSAAAEIISEPYIKLLEEMNRKNKILTTFFQMVIDNLRNDLKFQSINLLDPRKKLQQDILKTDEISKKLYFLINSSLKETRINLENKKIEFNQYDPRNEVINLQDKIKSSEKYLQQEIKNKLKINFQSFRGLVSELEAFSPLKVLARGYSITKNKSSDKIIRNSKNVKLGDMIISTTSEISIESKVTKIE
tara:strand:- start:13603 stop:14958 length:1356 start_codon:yes stop_codon:yes gene_type:complete